MFMKSTWKKYLLYAVYILLASGLLYGLLQLILSGYSVTWTGFQTKTLWDWMELLIIPIVLALGAFALNRSERTVERENANNRADLEREIAKDRQQEAALQTYFGRISELLINEKLRTAKQKEVRDIARTWTLTALRGLDATRKGLVVRFLHEAGLIYKEKYNVDLRGADLRGADLHVAILDNAYIHDVYLQGANLQDAILKDADMRRTFLNGANLTRTFLAGANLQGVVLKDAAAQSASLEGSSLEWADLQNINLQHANLVGTKLTGAIMDSANLAGANLKGAKVTPEQLAQAKSLKGATMPDGTIHE